MFRTFRNQSFNQLQAERHRLADEFGIIVGGERGAAVRKRVSQLVDRKLFYRTAGKEQCRQEHHVADSCHSPPPFQTRISISSRVVIARDQRRSIWSIQHHAATFAQGSSWGKRHGAASAVLAGMSWNVACRYRDHLGCK